VKKADKASGADAIINRFKNQNGKLVARNLVLDFPLQQPSIRQALAVPAEQPHTELIITKVVPSFDN